jgi:hypothetical protein
LAGIDVYFLTIDTEDSFRNALQSLIDPKVQPSAILPGKCERADTPPQACTVAKQE